MAGMAFFFTAAGFCDERPGGELAEPEFYGIEKRNFEVGVRAAGMID